MRRLIRVLRSAPGLRGLPGNEPLQVGNPLFLREESDHIGDRQSVALAQRRELRLGLEQAGLGRILSGHGLLLGRWVVLAIECRELFLELAEVVGAWLHRETGLEWPILARLRTWRHRQATATAGAGIAPGAVCLRAAFRAARSPSLP